MATQDKLLIQDTRTQKRYEIPIEHNSISAIALKAIKAPAEGSDPRDRVSNGLRVLDPGLINTAIGKSDATWVDTNKGYIVYRGYTIDQLQSCDFEDVFYLMIWGDLPTTDQRESLRHALAQAMCNIPPSVVDTIRSFPRASHPMPMLAAGLAAYIAADPYSIPTFVGEPIYHGDAKKTEEAIISATAAYAIVFGLACSHSASKDFVPPGMHESFYYNFVAMSGNVESVTGQPSVKVLRALRQYGAVMLDHGQTNSTFAMGVTASSLAHPLSALISSLMAAYGELHFGAQETAYRKLQKLRTPDNVQAYLEEVKKGKERVHGFGHRTYKSVDVRVPYALRVIESLGTERAPLLPVAKELNRAVQSDEFFQKKNLKPNVDIYGILVYGAMGWGPQWSPALLFLQRLPGLMNSWRQAMLSPKPVLLRPADIFVGSTEQKTTEKHVRKNSSTPYEVARL